MTASTVINQMLSKYEYYGLLRRKLASSFRLHIQGSQELSRETQNTSLYKESRLNIKCPGKLYAQSLSSLRPTNLFCHEPTSYQLPQSGAITYIAIPPVWLYHVTSVRETQGTDNAPPRAIARSFRTMGTLNVQSHGFNIRYTKYRCHRVAP